MVDNRIIKHVQRADRERREVCIEQRRKAAAALMVRSLLCALGAMALFYALSATSQNVMAMFAAIPCIQSVADFRRHRFHRRIVRIHDEWTNS